MLSLSSKMFKHLRKDNHIKTTAVAVPAAVDVGICCGLRHCAIEIVFVLALVLLQLAVTLPIGIEGAEIGLKSYRIQRDDDSNANNTRINANSQQPQLEQLKEQLQQQEEVVIAYNDPHFKSKRHSTIVQLFEWKFVDIAKECKQFLGPKGYGGVQLSPVTEHLVIRDGAHINRPWWERYHPISYKIATRSGTEEEFADMSRACNAAGVRVYVDVVLNHMAGYGRSNMPHLGTAGNEVNVINFSYPAIPYTYKDFHKPCKLENYMDAHEVRNCQLDGQRPDLDHSRAEVRERIVEMLNKLIDMGVAGFRLDAAKYMWPLDLKQIFNAVKNLNSEEFDFPANARPLFYMDVLDMGMDGVSKTEYITYGIVEEYLYAAEMATIINGKAPLSSLINWGPAMGFVTHQHALVFVNTQPNQPGLPSLTVASPTASSSAVTTGDNNYEQLLSYRQRHKYIMANAFMLAHPYGRIKRIMSSYRYASDTNADNMSAPVNSGGGDEQISSPTFDENGECTPDSDWVCEHRWPAIANMIELMNTLSEDEDIVINFQTDGPNRIAFCRGQKAFIAINNDPIETYAAELHTCLEEGVYCDVISGGLAADGRNCFGKRVTVKMDGYVDVMIPVAKEAIEDINELANINEYIEDDFETIVAEEFGMIAIHVGSKLSGEKELESNTNSLEGEGKEEEKDIELAEETAKNGEEKEETFAEENNDVKKLEGEETKESVEEIAETHEVVKEPEVSDTEQADDKDVKTELKEQQTETQEAVNEAVDEVNSEHTNETVQEPSDDVESNADIAPEVTEVIEEHVEEGEQTADEREHKEDIAEETQTIEQIQQENTADKQLQLPEEVPEDLIETATEATVTEQITKEIVLENAAVNSETTEIALEQTHKPQPELTKNPESIEASMLEKQKVSAEAQDMMAVTTEGTLSLTNDINSSTLSLITTKTTGRGVRNV